MSYKKQGFVDGTVLHANPLNKMDAQVLNNANAIGDLDDLKTIIKTTLVDAINEIANKGSSTGSIEIMISDTPPENGPAFWFDTSALSDE